MDEAFESRQLVAPEALAVLRQRDDARSLKHFALQVLAVIACLSLVVLTAHVPLLALAATILLRAVWASLFAPLHECTHGTAFRSRDLNSFASWLAGLLLGFVPSVYRSLHFLHLRLGTSCPERPGGLQRSCWKTGYRDASWPS